MSVMFGLLLSASVSLAAPAPAEPPGETNPGPVASVPRVTTILVRAGAPGGEGLLEDLRLRLPEPVIGMQPASQPPEGLTVYVALHELAEDDAWALELVTSDGRGFDRVLQMEEEWSSTERRRFAAANIAQLIEGVEAGTVPPDRDAVVPPQVCEVQTTPGPPEVILVPGVVAVPCPEPLPEAPTPAPARRWLLGVRAAPTAVVGLGQPDDRSRFSGGGGLLGLVARAPSGVLILTEVRGLRASSSTLDTSLGRARISLGSGAVLRAGQGGGELELQGALSVEPWWVRRDGDAVTVPGRRPALGAWARVVAGATWGWGATRLRVGGWTELAVSGVVGGDGIQAAGISLETDEGEETLRTPAFRVGGLEVSAGLELRLAFAVGAR